MIVALVSIVLVSVGGVDKAHAAFWERSRPAKTQTTIKMTGRIAEASPPIALQELRQTLDSYQPQITILNPRKNEVLSDNTVSVRFLVKDLPIFKNETFSLGPHLHVLLDNHTYQAVYDTSQPLVFNDLEPGTHTIRAFASRPWHESFKNDGAFAQTTFHVFTKTQDNSPNPDLPLLTYSRPQGTYGAEPILLDFYLTNAPLHLVAQADEADDIADWQIRCTVNGDRFLIDRWQPLYLKGFKPGKNWVQLEYLDDKGNPVQNVFNNTVRVVDYQPNGDDALSKLVRGELSATDVRGIVDPNYIPPAPAVEPSPEASPSPSAIPQAEPSPDSTSKLDVPESKLDVPDRPDVVAPPLPVPEPSSSPSPAMPEVVIPELEPADSKPAPELVIPEPAKSEPAFTPSKPTTPSDAIVQPILQLERPSEPETTPIPSSQPASPKNTIAPADQSLTGQERLRQVWQQLGQYLPQQRRAIRAPHTQVNIPSSDEETKTESDPTPSVSIPAPLPPTLPEIIDAKPLDQPAVSTPASSSIE